MSGQPQPSFRIKASHPAISTAPVTNPYEPSTARPVVNPVSDSKASSSKGMTMHTTDVADEDCS